MNWMESMEIPEQVHERCKQGVRRARWEKRKKRLGGMAAAAAAVVLMGMLALNGGSVAQSIWGFFEDIVRWDGAVVGTRYEQATSQVRMQVVAADTSGVTVEVDFLQEGFPWREMEELALGNMEIAGLNGLKSGKSPVKDGKAQVVITWDGMLPAGSYVLEIHSVWGYKKADQPLECEGEWNCIFVVE